MLGGTSALPLCPGRTHVASWVLRALCWPPAPVQGQAQARGVLTKLASLLGLLKALWTL